MYSLPSVHTAKAYQRKWLRFDLIAGVVIASLAIPQSLAYAEIAGLPPVSGVVAAIIAMLVYSLLGGSSQLMTGPEATVSLLTASVLAALAQGDVARYIALAATLAMLVGVILMLASVLRLGVLADMFGRAILVGYLTGVAILLLVSQLGKFLGVKLNTENLYLTAQDLLAQSPDISSSAAAVGFVSLAILIFSARRWPTFPMALLLIVAGIVMESIWQTSSHGVPVLGDIAFNFSPPSLSLITWHDIVILLPGALGISLMAFTDTVLTARSFAMRRGYKVDGNQELLALGASNIATGLLGTYPVAASNSRTAVNDLTGGKTQLTGIIASIVLILSLLLLMPYIARAPLPIFGAIITMAALRLIDPQSWRALWRVRRSEFTIAIIATLGVLVLGLLQGIFLAVALSFLNIMRRSISPYRAVLGRDADGHYLNQDRHQTEDIPGHLIYRFSGPLFFANSRILKEQILEHISEKSGVHTFVLECEGVTDLDSDGIDMLKALRSELAKMNIVFKLAEVTSPIRDILLRANGENWNFYGSVSEAVADQV